MKKLVINVPEEKKDIYYINGVPVVNGDSKIDMDGLSDIFENYELDPKALRESAWQREFYLQTFKI